MHKSYKYKIYPSSRQKILFAKTFGCVRFLWNQSVEAFDKKETRKSSTQLRHEFEWMKEVSAAAIQQKELDFKATLEQKFSKSRKTKLGNLNFKSRRDKQSYRLPNQKFELNFETSKIRLEKIGWVKVVIDRTFEGRTLSATISKDSVGDYFVSVLVEEVIPPKPKTNRSVGIDVGLKALITTSDGLQVLGLPDNQREIKHIQRRMARKTKGSTRWLKLKTKLAKLHRKQMRKRDWLLHNISKFLAENYDTIVVEDLNIKGMMKNHKLARVIGQASWSKLNSMIDYKCNFYGREIVKIDRWFPSSKMCGNCGSIKDDLKLSDRVYSCSCGYTIDRDLNAAINILAVGVTTDHRTVMECKTKGVEKLIPLAIPNDLFRFL